MEFAFSVMRTKRFGRVVASAAACVLVMGLSWTAGAVERALTGPAAGTIGLPQPLFGGILRPRGRHQPLVGHFRSSRPTPKRLQPAEGLGAASLAIPWGEDRISRYGRSLQERSGRGATGRLIPPTSTSTAGDMVAVSVNGS